MYLRGGNKKHLFPGNGNNEIKSFKRALISHRLKKYICINVFRSVIIIKLESGRIKLRILIDIIN